MSKVRVIGAHRTADGFDYVLALSCGHGARIPTETVAMGAMGGVPPVWECRQCDGSPYAEEHPRGLELADGSTAADKLAELLRRPGAVATWHATALEERVVVIAPRKTNDERKDG